MVLIFKCFNPKTLGISVQCILKVKQLMLPLSPPPPPPLCKKINKKK